MFIIAILVATLWKRNRQGSAASRNVSVLRAADASQRSRPRVLAAVVIACSVLGGCATAQNPDPIERVNRGVFAVNEGIDKVLLKPVATAYRAVVPAPARTGVSNFFSNLSDPWSGVNLMMQGRFKDGFSDIARFGTNTTVGVLGFVDVASDWGMPRHGAEFGGTLGSWGVGTGAYLVLPLFGPSSVRDFAALPVNAMGNPQSQFTNVPLRNSLTAVNMVNKRERALDATKMIDEASLDKYLFVRDAYLQRRRQGAGDDAKSAPVEELGNRNSDGPPAK